jgi:uncharacterized protein DUF1801
MPEDLAMPTPTMPPAVAAAFDALPTAARERLLALRSLILDTAEATSSVGRVTETLKWGEPAYLTEATRSGSTIRLGLAKGDPPRCALYFNCKTSLVEEFRSAFPDAFGFGGNRAVLLDPDRPIPAAALAQCVATALTYHRRRRKA